MFIESQALALHVKDAVQTSMETGQAMYVHQSIEAGTTFQYISVLHIRQLAFDQPVSAKLMTALAALVVTTGQSG